MCLAHRDYRKWVRLLGMFCSNTSINCRRLSCDHWEQIFKKNKWAALYVCVCTERESERACVIVLPHSFPLVSSDSSCRCSANQFISSQEVVNRKYSTWSPPTLPASSHLPDPPHPTPFTFCQTLLHIFH